METHKESPDSIHECDRILRELPELVDHWMNLPDVHGYRDAGRLAANALVEGLSPELTAHAHEYIDAAGRMPEYVGETLPFNYLALWTGIHRRLIELTEGDPRLAAMHALLKEDNFNILFTAQGELEEMLVAATKQATPIHTQSTRDQLSDLLGEDKS